MLLPLPGIFFLCGLAVSVVAAGSAAVGLPVGVIFFFVHDGDIVVGSLARRYSAARRASAFRRLRHHHGDEQRVCLRHDEDK